MKNCEHIEATFDRDGKECKKCGLSWRLCLKQKREAKKGVHFYPSSFYWQEDHKERLRAERPSNGIRL